MINRIEFQTNYYANPDGSGRRVEQIALHVMDMWLYKDITCERDEHLAQRLADEQGVTLYDMREGANAPPPLTPEEQEEFAESFRVFAERVEAVEEGRWSIEAIRGRANKAADRAEKAAGSSMKVSDELGASVSFEYPGHD